MGVPMIFVYAVIPISGVIGIARLIRYLLSDTTTAVKD
jgi:TRAP-type C4-dicarboxylate transport system permease small subunit